MDKRTKIMELIEKEGPADAASLAARENWCKWSTRQLMARMVEDGQLTTLKNAPRTYITTGLK